MPLSRWAAPARRSPIAAMCGRGFVQQCRPSLPCRQETGRVLCAVSKVSSKRYSRYGYPLSNIPIAVPAIEARGVMSQYGYMKKPKKPAPNRIAEERKASGLSQQELADAVGAHWITISKLERGKIKLTTQWMEKLAAALDVGERDLLRSAKPIAKALVIGSVTDSGEVIVFPESEWTNTSIRSSHFAQGAWLAVDTEFYSPILHPGDFVFLSLVSPTVMRSPLSGNLKTMTGRLAFVEHKKRRGLIGMLSCGAKPGLWDLYLGEHRVLHDVRPKSIYIVTATLCTFPMSTKGDLTERQ